MLLLLLLLLPTLFTLLARLTLTIPRPPWNLRATGGCRSLPALLASRRRRHAHRLHVLICMHICICRVLPHRRLSSIVVPARSCATLLLQRFMVRSVGREISGNKHRYATTARSRTWATAVADPMSTTMPDEELITIADRVAGALWGMLIFDGHSMPVHWFYAQSPDPADIFEHQQVREASAPLSRVDHGTE